MLPRNTDDSELDKKAECIVLGEVLSLIGDKWTILIVGSLSLGPQRFNELRRTIDGISQRILTLKLRRLEEERIVSRTVIPTTPPGVEYALTSYGETLIEPLTSLNSWAQRHRRYTETNKYLD